MPIAVVEIAQKIEAGGREHSAGTREFMEGGAMFPTHGLNHLEARKRRPGTACVGDTVDPTRVPQFGIRRVHGSIYFDNDQ
jgi:hypothetical protein